MKCADPVLCYTDTNYKKLYRHFSIVQQYQPWMLKLSHMVFNCGKCLYCRKKKAYELACRCVLHASLYKENCFLTLTYDEKKEGYHNNLEYSHIQKFKKKLRSYVYRKYKKKIEIFNVHEYGKNKKKHWHLIIFNWSPEDKEIYTCRNGITLYTSGLLSKRWTHGYSSVGDVTEASAMYQSQYMEKDFKNGTRGSDKASKSNHSGIAGPYFKANYSQILRLGYVPINGQKLPIPRYFEKIAHKHWSHFYMPQNFFDNALRKALYRPFTKEEPNLELANLYMEYKELKDQKILDLEKEWDETISQYLTTNKEPDFIKSNENALYDLRNKQTKEIF